MAKLPDHAAPGSRPLILRSPELATSAARKMTGGAAGGDLNPVLIRRQLSGVHGSANALALGYRPVAFRFRIPSRGGRQLPGPLVKGLVGGIEQMDCSLIVSRSVSGVCTPHQEEPQIESLLVGREGKDIARLLGHQSILRSAWDGVE